MMGVVKYRLFYISGIVTAVGLLSAFLWGGTKALFITGLLAILEVTLSFDNAVVNAKILKRMNALWQERFLTWGILVAVFGTRVFLPILIVAASVGASPWVIATLAVNDSVQYAKLVADAHYAIGAFGGIFLLLVSLKYFFDAEKNVHWISAVERRLARWGSIEAIEIALALVGIAVLSVLVDSTHQSTVLFSGLIGAILFIVIEGVASSFDVEAKGVAGSSIALFLYLNVLDSAFSLDGVVGAFALSSDLVVIGIGLGIGAFFVRSLTVFFVRERMLDTLVYLEHGAHWAIFGLAMTMLGGLLVPINEVIIGLIGFVFIVLAYVSSKKALR
ncbi:MAG: DUF475 domain-containing protein [Patescibacteria group bacterium]